MRSGAKRVHGCDALKAAVLILKDEAGLGIVKGTYRAAEGGRYLMFGDIIVLVMVTYWRNRKGSRLSSRSHLGKGKSRRS